MHCFTKAEEVAWLLKQRMPLEPYVNSTSDYVHYLQFYPPKQFAGVANFIDCVLEETPASADFLLTIIDMGFFRKHEVKLIERLREAQGETRSIYNAPGHLFSGTEIADAVGLFSLTVAFGWQAYFYLPSKNSVILNWEGAIFDFWTNDITAESRMLAFLKGFGLEKTKNMPGEGGIKIASSYPPGPRQ